ncbi:DNA repair protein radA [Klebsiella pneumoniae]|nr:DNA repair protein radA [Klebsiella pneumoniae]
MTVYTPKLTKISNKVKPSVAPDTKANVFLKPCITPEEIMTILTGPGENDRAREYRNIVAIKTIFTSTFPMKDIGVAKLI